MATAWQQRLARPRRFPVIKPPRMSAGYPSPRPHQHRPILRLLTHTFHAEPSSFLRSHGGGNASSTGEGVSGEPLAHLSDVHRLAWPCRSPSHRSPNTSAFTPQRLLSCGDCGTGPFSGSQEIPHSAEVRGCGDAQLQLSRFPNSPTAAFFFGNNKKPPRR